MCSAGGAQVFCGSSKQFFLQSPPPVRVLRGGAQVFCGSSKQFWRAILHMGVVCSVFLKIGEIILHEGVVCSECAPNRVGKVYESVGAPGVTFGVYNTICAKRSAGARSAPAAH